MAFPRFLIGSVSLFAWTSGSPTLIAFKSIPAFPFIISGLALCALQSRKLKSPVHIAGLVFAAALCFISGHDLIDLLMASSQDSLESMSGGFAFSVLNSLAANDALSLLLISIALLCVDLPTNRFRLADPFTIVAAFFVDDDFTWSYFRHSRLLCLHLLPAYFVARRHSDCSTLTRGLFIRPEQGLASIMTRDTAGGVLARRLLPAAVLVPLLLGWLRMQGEHFKLYTSEMGLTLLVSSWS